MSTPWPKPYRVTNLRTGKVEGWFDDYVAAAQYRRDVLYPTLPAWRDCPWHVEVDCIERRQADAEFAEFTRQTKKMLAALPKPAVQGELFGVIDFMGAIS